MLQLPKTALRDDASLRGQRAYGRPVIPALGAVNVLPFTDPGGSPLVPSDAALGNTPPKNDDNSVTTLDCNLVQKLSKKNINQIYDMVFIFKSFLICFFYFFIIKLAHLCSHFLR